MENLQQQQESSPQWRPTISNMSMAGMGVLATGIAEQAHQPAVAVLTILASVAAARYGDNVLELVEQLSSSQGRSTLLAKMSRRPHDRAVVDEVEEKTRLLPETLDVQQQGDDTNEDAFDLNGEDDMPRPRSARSGMFLFSSLLDEGFSPSIDRIFLARTPSGIDLYCSARDLCHVALAGNTGGGKSSIMRMLMAQLCHARMQVLLLNPHYTRYDLDNDEDWTPFETYLVHDPMECRKYEVIEHYLKYAAEELVPRRLDKRAQSQPVGKPYFLVLDELPSIVRHIPGAPDYLRVILEEGRKVGVLLISAAQDFLVKTISPNAGGGSIRECYRTAYYVGGDPTTARTLLDMQAKNIAEDELGKGVVMLRAVPSKKASQVDVPYADNASLYRLLGPSTYQPASSARARASASTQQDVPLPPPSASDVAMIINQMPDVDPQDTRYQPAAQLPTQVIPSPYYEQTAFGSMVPPVAMPDRIDASGYGRIDQIPTQVQRPVYRLSPAKTTLEQRAQAKVGEALRYWQAGHNSVRKLQRVSGWSDGVTREVIRLMRKQGLIEQE